MEWVVFPLFLLLASAVLLVAEVFVPSAGILTVLAIACGIWGISLFFQHNIVAGWIGIGSAGVLIPGVLVIAYKVFPKTPFGKAMLLAPPEDPQGDGVPDADELRSLLGRVGRVQAVLHPVGLCDFSGRRVECVAESGYVERGKSVEVIAVQGAQLTVRETEG